MVRLAVLLSLTLCAWLPSVARGDSKQAWKFSEKDQFFVEWKWLVVEKTRHGGQFNDNMFELHMVAQYTVEKADAEVFVFRKRFGNLGFKSLAGTQQSPFKQLEGAAVRVTFDHDMKLVKCDGLAEVSGVDPNLPNAAQMVASLERLLAPMESHAFIPLPADKMDKGSSWKRPWDRLGNAAVEIEKTFTHRGVDSATPALFRIQMTGSARPWLDPGRPAGNKHDITAHEYNGDMLFDSETGRLRHAEYRTRLGSGGKYSQFPGAPSMGFGVDMITQWTICFSKEDPTERSGSSNVVQAGFQEKEVDKLPREWTNSVGMKFVQVPAGKFRMGSTGFGRNEFEKPHDVEISRPFHMGVHEVTIGQFQKFVEDTGYQSEAERSGKGNFGFNKSTQKIEPSEKFCWKNPGWDHDDKHPAAMLSWEDAKAFCQWLSKKEGKEYRLPTEAEWEYACRAGTTTAYSCGDDSGDLAKHGNILDMSGKKHMPAFQEARHDDGFAFTAPVGSFQPNAWGLYDMHGNVLEWCEDWQFHYSGLAEKDPLGPPFGVRKINRGGGFPESPHQATVSFRGFTAPETYNISTGFRVVLSSLVLPPYERQVGWAGKRVMPRDGSGIGWLHRDAHMPYFSPAGKVVRERLGSVSMILHDGREVTEEKENFVPVDEALKLYTKELFGEPTTRTYYLRACAFQALKNPGQALKDLDEAIKLDESDPWMRIARAQLRRDADDAAGALQDYEAAVKIRDRNPWIHNAIAWYLATSVNPKGRDGKRAVEHAIKARDLAQVPTPYVLDTLAAAHAEAGDFDEAVKCQTEANQYLQLARALKDIHRERLELYRQKLPYRHVQ